MDKCATAYINTFTAKVPAVLILDVNRGASVAAEQDVSHALLMILIKKTSRMINVPLLNLSPIKKPWYTPSVLILTGDCSECETLLDEVVEDDLANLRFQGSSTFH